MLLGYNTNGLAHHDCFEAVELLAELGYQGVAITLDHNVLNPYGGHYRERMVKMRRLLASLGMRSVIETGARFLLDRWQKHEPTLVSADPVGRARRVEFLKHAIDVAKKVESDCVSFWSGVVHDGVGEDEAFDRLVPALAQVIEYAAEQHVTLAFEPEPGMFIDRMTRYQQLLERIDAPHFRLTLDIGHLHCLGETPIAEQIERWGNRLANVHIEDMRAGVHEHLMFGSGEIDFPPIIAALRAADYSGALHVELSRHSHDGPNTARQAMEFLKPLLDT